MRRLMSLIIIFEIFIINSITDSFAAPIRDYHLAPRSDAMSWIWSLSPLAIPNPEEMRRTEDLICHLETNSLTQEIFYPAEQTDALTGWSVSFNSGEVTVLPDPDVSEQNYIPPSVLLTVTTLRDWPTCTVFADLSFSSTTAFRDNAENIPSSAFWRQGHLFIPMASPESSLRGQVQHFDFRLNLRFVGASIHYPVRTSCRLIPRSLHPNRTPYRRFIPPSSDDGS